MSAHLACVPQVVRPSSIVNNAVVGTIIALVQLLVTSSNGVIVRACGGFCYLPSRSGFSADGLKGTIVVPVAHSHNGGRVNVVTLLAYDNIGAISFLLKAPLVVFKESGAVNCARKVLSRAIVGNNACFAFRHNLEPSWRISS